jgi:LacI family transcriptional regulator
MVTLKDIADEAGVSTATISNVINGNMSKVSIENASRIQKIIEKRQYVPNSSARTLAVKSSHIIAGVLLGGHDVNMLLDPYNAEFFGELICTVQERGYYLMIRYVNSYEEVIHSLRSWNIDGAVFVGTSDEYIKKIQKAIQIPLIFTDSYTNQQKINNVGIDDFRGGGLAAEYFLSRGHRTLGFVGYSIVGTEKNVVSERLSGFSSVLDTHGIKLTEKQCFYVSVGDPREDIQKIAARLADRKGDITGIFVSADILAIALMEALSEQGMNVPEDISVIGFDDVSITANIVPGLTTIRQKISQKAQIATDLLFRQIEGKLSPRNSTLEVSLVERDSVSFL